MSPWRRLLQNLARRQQKGLDAREERGRFAQWFLLAGMRVQDDWCNPDPAGLTPIYPPGDAFWADPFAWSAEGRRVVFCEEYSFRTRLGRIGALELSVGEGGRIGPVGPMVPIVDEPRHLSYPFLFSFDGELYMVPESAASRSVDLYRCTGFPHAWSRVGTLMTGIEAADSTLFEHEGRWWLFCAARLGRTRLNESLLAFYADSPLSGRWTPHAGNPLIRDYSGGRPGGRIFRGPSGQPIRPAQNSVPRYGYGLTLNEILILTPERYAERRIWSVTGAASGGWRAMHHLDWHDGLMVMDAQRLIQAA
jgi:hypothetical protein